MALIPHKGSWGLPDFGLTERLERVLGGSGSSTAQGGSNLSIGYTAPQEARAAINVATQQIDRPSNISPGNVLGANTSAPQNQGGGVPTGQSTGQPVPSGNSGGNFGNTGGGGPSELDVINQEFDAFNSFLNDQSGLANQRFSNLETQIGQDQSRGLEQISGQRGLRAKELEAKALSGRENERLNLQKVRQLLGDLEQRNAARLAVTGGGSASDAMAEQFGRTAQQSVGDVLREGQRFQSDVGIEQERANQFYDQKAQEVRDRSATQIAQARQTLNENLSAIENERRASAAEKQRARLNSWKSYYDNVNRARLEAANFQAQYDMWKNQLDAQIAAAQGYTPNAVSGQDFSSALQTAYGNQGFSVNPQAGALENPQQYAATYFSPGARPDETEDQVLGQ